MKLDPCLLHLTRVKEFNRIGPKEEEYEKLLISRKKEKKKKRKKERKNVK